MVISPHSKVPTRYPFRSWTQKKESSSFSCILILNNSWWPVIYSLDVPISVDNVTTHAYAHFVLSALVLSNYLTRYSCEPGPSSWNDNIITEYSILIRWIWLIHCFNIGLEYQGTGSGLLSMPLYNTNSIIHTYRLTICWIQQHCKAILGVG